MKKCVWGRVFSMGSWKRQSQAEGKYLWCSHTKDPRQCCKELGIRDNPTDMQHGSGITQQTRNIWRQEDLACVSLHVDCPPKWSLLLSMVTSFCLEARGIAKPRECTLASTRAANKKYQKNGFWQNNEISLEIYDISLLSCNNSICEFKKYTSEVKLHFKNFRLHVWIDTSKIVTLVRFVTSVL